MLRWPRVGYLPVAPTNEVRYDFDDKTKNIDLPVKKEGAYLVMVRGDDRYTSGILLVSPLELQVLEESGSRRRSPMCKGSDRNVRPFFGGMRMHVRFSRKRQDKERVSSLYPFQGPKDRRKIFRPDFS